APGFRHARHGPIMRLDLLGSTVVRHYVPARPQCPVCGRRTLRDPRRRPVPIELGAGGKLVMTSGGYRTVSSRATVARFRKHVSPLPRAGPPPPPGVPPPPLLTHPPPP